MLLAGMLGLDLQSEVRLGHERWAWAIIVCIPSMLRVLSQGLSG